MGEGYRLSGCTWSWMPLFRIVAHHSHLLPPAFAECCSPVHLVRLLIQFSSSCLQLGLSTHHPLVL